MRKTFINELVKLATKNNNVALIVGDLGYSVIEPFAEKFPERFINAGVAEQNMLGLAAGMASEGYHVFVYSIANFPTFRCAEQIRNDVAYHNLPVTIVAVGGGLAYGPLGYSHHAVQDYALMRTMPGMMIAAPGDPMEVKACMNYLIENPGPSYLRLGKEGEPNFHTNQPVVKPGQWLLLKSGSNNKRAFLTTGACLEIVMNIANQEKNLDIDIYSLPLWSMNHKHLQLSQIQKYEEIITVEDHLEDAGFGSWVLESIGKANHCKDKIKIKALNSEVCGMVGGQKILNEAGGLNKLSLI